MIRIAVVGDIGSGKSHVAKLFGYPVFNADNEVAKIYKKNKKSFNKLKKALPQYINSFPVKKSAIINAITSHSENLKKIVRIIHPEIRKKMQIFIKKNKNKKFIVLDIPLLLENKINRKNDIIVFVEAKKKQINKKLKKRFKSNFKIIKKFKKIQLPLEIKKKRSQFIVKNDFRNDSIKKNVKVIKKKLL